MSKSPEVTFTVEHSWEATTLDYLSPLWYVTKEGFESEEAAEAFRVERRAAAIEPIVYRVKKVVAPRPEGGYVDQGLEADFAANARYWADRAAEADRIAEAKREFKVNYGKGAKVKVVKGRKVSVGTEGIVFWLGEGNWGWRVGFNDAEGNTHWTAVDNVEPIKEEVFA